MRFEHQNKPDFRFVRLIAKLLMKRLMQLLLGDDCRAVIGLPLTHPTEQGKIYK